MPPRVIVLVMLSCLLHAYWNLVVKGSSRPAALVCLALVATTVIYAPATIAFLLTDTWPAVVWLYLLAAGFCIGLYILGLGLAYRAGDLSLVYPVARTSPIFIYVLAAATLGEAMTLWGGVAIAMVVGGAAGLFWMPQHAASAPNRPVLRKAALLWALFASVTNAISHVFDRAAMQMLPNKADLAHVAYLHLEFAVTLLTVMLAYGLWVRGHLLQIWRDEKGRIVKVGIFQAMAYLLILVALSVPEAKVAYVAGLRQMSILIGVLMGWRVLKEREAMRRLPMAGIMAAGLILLAWGK